MTTRLSNLSLRTILSCVLGIIVGALAGLSSQQLKIAYDRHATASSVASLTAVDDYVFQILTSIRYERGDTLTVLGAPLDKGIEAKNAVLRHRVNVDSAVGKLRETIDLIKEPEVLTAASQVLTDYETAKAMRPAVDADWSLALEARDKSLLGRFLAPFDKMVTQTLVQGLTATETEIVKLDPALSDLVATRIAAWSARSATGNNVLLLNAAALRSRKLSPEEMRSLFNDEGRSAIVWEQVREMARSSRAQADLKQAVSVAEATSLAGPFKEIRDDMVKTVSAGGTPVVDFGRWRPEFLKALDAMSNVATVAIAQMRDVATATVARAQLALIAYGCLLVMALAIGLVGFWIVHRRITAPITALTASMTRLAEGDLSASIPGSGRSDEIGGIAAAMQVFKENGLKMRALEALERDESERRRQHAEAMASVVSDVGEVVAAAAAGDFSARLRIDDADEQMRKLVAGINEINAAVDGATTEFAEILQGIAGGDLTTRVETSYRGRFKDLKDAINETVERLSATVRTIQVTSADVGLAAREINMGADDLSKRTEEQASSLEETAATTEELAASVKASAQGSRQAATIADEAMQAAKSGGAIATEAVAAMARIESASQKISDIIRVIDDIAFQTNLLALNAAVEAARAGDAGKGFAVVASEVRTLAQRSSSAAKDISGLISSSNAEVGAGVKLVRQAGDQLAQILAASQKVAGTIAEISAASGEQASGIDEMSQAVAHLDEMTQANAALAEESAASAASLTGKIGQLNELVAAFRTGHDGQGHHSQGHAAAALPHPAAARRNAEPARLQKLAEAAFAQSRQAPAPMRAPAKKVANARAGDAGWEEF